MSFSTATHRTGFTFSVTVVSGLLATLVALPGMTNWFEGIAKPGAVPGVRLFLAVSLGTYVALGLSGEAVNSLQERRGHRMAMRWFWALLGLNAFWLDSFFLLKSFESAYFTGLMAWIAGLACLWTFSKLSGRAAWLLFPYLVWVTFCSTKNFQMLMLHQKPIIEKMNQDPANFDLTFRPDPHQRSEKTR